MARMGGGRGGSTETRNESAVRRDDRESMIIPQEAEAVPQMAERMNALLAQRKRETESGGLTACLA